MKVYDTVEYFFSLYDALSQTAISFRLSVLE